MAKRSVCTSTFPIAFCKELWVKFLTEWAQIAVLNYQNERAAGMKSMISSTDVAVILKLLEHRCADRYMGLEEVSAPIRLVCINSE